jgi:hypothetical protein
MCSGRSDTPLRVPSFLIRKSTDRSLVGSSPWLIAASRVLLRLQAPRHPPLALCSLKTKDARARYGILKGRAQTEWLLANFRERREAGARDQVQQSSGRHRGNFPHAGQTTSAGPLPQNGTVKSGTLRSARWDRPGLPKESSNHSAEMSRTNDYGAGKAPRCEICRITSDRLGVNRFCMNRHITP